MVEQRTENPCVDGSIPPLGTILPPVAVVQQLPAISALMLSIAQHAPAGVAGAPSHSSISVII